MSNYGDLDLKAKMNVFYLLNKMATSNGCYKENQSTK